MQSHNWIDFGNFFNFFVSFLQGTPNKRMTTFKIILSPQIKEPKICHALAKTSAFNLKLCHLCHLFTTRCRGKNSLGLHQIWTWWDKCGIGSEKIPLHYLLHITGLLDDCGEFGLGQRDGLKAIFCLPTQCWNESSGSLCYIDTVTEEKLWLQRGSSITNTQLQRHRPPTSDSTK